VSENEQDASYAALVSLLQKLGALSPAEARQLAAYSSRGARTEADAAARLRNGALQSSTARTLVMLSGGLDSVAMLYLMLQQEQGLPLHVHHVHLHGWESESKPVAESIAIRAVTDYLWEQGYRFEYSESEVRFDYSVFDQTIYYFQAACLAASMPRVKRVAVGRVAEDAAAINAGRLRVDPTVAGAAVFRSVIEQWPLQERAVEIIYPLEKYSKRSLPPFLPAELLAMVCSCRHPVILADDRWDACGECRKCVDFRKMLETQPSR
jgi:hypothetical protein